MTAIAVNGVYSLSLTDREVVAASGSSPTLLILQDATLVPNETVRVLVQSLTNQTNVSVRVQGQVIQDTHCEKLGIPGTQTCTIEEQCVWVEFYSDGANWWIAQPMVKLHRIVNNNYIIATNEITGDDPILIPGGIDTDIDLLLQGKGSGVVRAHGRSLNAGTADSICPLDSDSLVPAIHVPSALFTKRAQQVLVESNTANLINVGFSALPTENFNAKAASNSAARTRVRYMSGNVLNEPFGLITPVFTWARRGWNAEFICDFSTHSDISNCRFWIGLTSANLDLVDTPTTEHVSALSFSSTRAGETNWQFVTNDGTSSPQFFDTGIVAAIQQSLQIRIKMRDGVPDVCLYVAGSLVKQQTLNLPTQTQNLGWCVRGTNTAAAGRAIHFSRMALLQS